MQPTVLVKCRHVAKSSEVEAHARRLGEELQEIAPINQCRVTIEGPDRASSLASGYRVRIHIAVPGAEIHAASDEGPAKSHDDCFLALQDVFGSARRQLRAWRLEPGRDRR